MRISQIICLVVAAAGSLGTPAIARAQTPSAFLAVQKITSDPTTSKMRVVVKNVGQQKVTACGLLASSQQYTQEFVYSVGMEPKLTLSRPPGFGGIQPGESVELLFPLSQGGALTAEVNAVILEDRTAVGDENEIASMFRQRLAYASEWGRWALVMREDPTHYRPPAMREGERAEMLRVLPQDPNERGDAATVAGRMAARRALASLLTQTTAANRASLLEYVEERAVSLGQHAQRAGWIASYAEPTAVAKGRHANVKPSTSEVRMDEFSCRYPGQPLGAAGYADILRSGGSTQGSSTSKAGTLSAAATGACGVSGPRGAISVPTCTPAFFTTASSSASSATITGLSYSYIPALGCMIAGSQAATTLVSKTNVVAEDSESCAVNPAILFNGTDVTNGSSNVIIGQLINLSVTAGGTISTVAWSVPGTIVGGYTASSTSGSTSTATLNVTSPNFYWVNSGSSRTVSVSVTLSDGSTGSATTTFNVVAPSGTMSTTSLDSTKILIDTTCGYLCAHYGPSGSSGGVHFSHTYTAPSGYSGSFQWVQIGSTTQSRTNATTHTVQTLSPNPCGGLDTNYPYDTSNPTNDSPAQELLVGYSDRQRSDSYTMTLMFEPAGTSAIFVPIASVGWGWAFDATSSDGGNTWGFASRTAAGTLSPAASTTFPTWSSNLSSCHF